MPPKKKPSPRQSQLKVVNETQTEKGYKTLSVVLKRFGQKYHFELCKRKLDMGSAKVSKASRLPGQEARTDPSQREGDKSSKLIIDYYWMNTIAFRRGDAGANFRPIVDLWWASMHANGKQPDKHDLANLVFAESFPLVNTSRGRQKVFLDAIVSKNVSSWNSLPLEERESLRKLVCARDPNAIRAKIKDLFVREGIPETLKRAYNEAAGRWIVNGSVAFKKSGATGLRRWVNEELGPILGKYRKAGNRGGSQTNLRLFVNAWAYECKVGFYTCYANAWVCLLEELERNGLDAASSRCMRLWHSQNPNDTGEDVFKGQVLALNPLSREVMQKPEHLAALWKWLTLAANGHTESTDFASVSKEYLEVVVAILAAATEYRNNWDLANEARNLKGQGATATGTAEKPTETELSPKAFQNYAEYRELSCLFCRVALKYKSYTKKDVDGDSVVLATYKCPSCGKTDEIEFCD
jgi:hypothetical protein